MLEVVRCRLGHLLRQGVDFGYTERQGKRGQTGKGSAFKLRIQSGKGYISEFRVHDGLG